MWNNDKVKITVVEEMEGLQFGLHYFEDRTEFFISPSMEERLKNKDPNETVDIKFVMLSWERPGRDIIGGIDINGINIIGPPWAGRYHIRIVGGSK